MYNLGIALSGGGARGFAHMGVFKALEEMGIYPEVVAGVSAGALVGTMYASGMNSSRMEEVVETANFFRLLFPEVSVRGLIGLSYLKDHLARYIPTDRIEELERPLFLGLSNLSTGEVEFWSEGPLGDCVAASCAIPLVFNPVEINDQIYVDGGLLMNFPVPVLRPQCRKLIGVNLIPPLALPVITFKKGLSATAIAIRCFYLAVINNSRPFLDQCDVLIQAPELYHYHLFQFRKKEEIFQIGYRAAMEKREEIEALVRSF